LARESERAPDTGRFAYLGPEERPEGSEDDRPRIVYRQPFWKDEDERMRYEKAVKACPLSKYGYLDVFAYLREVVTLAEGMAPQGEPVKAMWEER
jgi:hypothetical protein